VAPVDEESVRWSSGGRQLWARPLIERGEGGEPILEFPDPSHRRRPTTSSSRCASVPLPSCTDGAGEAETVEVVESNGRISHQAMSITFVPRRRHRHQLGYDSDGADGEVDEHE
jgi:hypothetical protein